MDTLLGNNCKRSGSEKNRVSSCQIKRKYTRLNNTSYGMMTSITIWKRVEKHLNKARYVMSKIKPEKLIFWLMGRFAFKEQCDCII